MPKAFIRTASTCAALSTLALSACTAGGDTDTAAESSAASSATQSTTAAPAQVVTSAEAPCPYLETTFVQDTVGQQISTSIVTTTTPAPGPGPKCEFVRPNGETAATVDTATAPDPATAQQLALDFAPGGNPVKAGDGGAVLVKQGQGMAVLAVYRSTTVVFVTINQESSLEATLLAEQALAVLP